MNADLQLLLWPALTACAVNMPIDSIDCHDLRTQHGTPGPSPQSYMEDVTDVSGLPVGQG